MQVKFLSVNGVTAFIACVNATHISMKLIAWKHTCYKYCRPHFFLLQHGKLCALDSKSIWMNVLYNMKKQQAFECPSLGQISFISLQ